MNTKQLLVIPIIFALVATMFIAFIPQTGQQPRSTPVASNKTANLIPMKLTSSAFAHEQSIPKPYSCDGNNNNPPLTISDVPENAKSLVLIMYDPDVPNAAHNFDHWLVFNMPSTTKEIKEASNPEGIMGQNGRGQSLYSGPCPPEGEHRYFFKLYALDIILELPEGASRQQIETAMQNHILAEAELMGRYRRG